MYIKSMSRGDIKKRLEELENQEWEINISIDFFSQNDWECLRAIRNERTKLLEELSFAEKEKSS